MNTGYDVYRYSIAIKCHFNGIKYDAITYKFKTPTNDVESYKKYVKSNLYQSLAEKLPTKQMLISFLISNYIVNPKITVDKLVKEESFSIYYERESRIQSLSYIFENELRHLLSSTNKQEIFKNNLILNKCMQNEISIETFIILNEIKPFYHLLEENKSNKKFMRICKKYRLFMNTDVDKYKKILVKVLGDI